MNQLKAGLHIRRSFRRSGSSMETIAVRGILAALGVAASMLLAVAPSSAETPQQHDWCYGKGGATPEMKMAGCTAFIISGDHSDVEVAYAFHTRGGATARSIQEIRRAHV